MLLSPLFFFIFEGRSSQLESWFLSISYWCFVILCDAISFSHTIGISLRTYSLFFVTFSRVRTIYLHFFILFYIFYSFIYLFFAVSLYLLYYHNFNLWVSFTSMQCFTPWLFSLIILYRFFVSFYLWSLLHHHRRDISNIFLSNIFFLIFLKKNKKMEINCTYPWKCNKK